VQDVEKWPSQQENRVLAKKAPVNNSRAPKSKAQKSSVSQRVANAHSRTRSDHSQETAEDYVEAVADIIRKQPTCRIADLAKHFAVSHVTVHRIIARLQAEGLVETQPYRPVTLTAKGEEIALLSRQRHEIVFQFLLAIGVSPDMAAIDAEGIEHHVSPQTLRQMEKWIDSGSPNRNN
jgi:DtxR family transcriptional regulator, manganese transport regulator